METEREILTERDCYSLYSESVGDYTLPDYNTDVKRMLMTRAEAVSAGAFLNGDSLEVSGVVNYEVIYLDADNEITSCSFSTDYDMAVRCQADSFAGGNAITRVNGFTVRLTSPRRLSVKAQLVSDVNITERDTLRVTGGATDSEGAQLRTKTAKIERRVYTEPKEREFAEELARIDGAIADDVVVLYSDCLHDVSATHCSGGAEIAGKLTLRSFVKREGELPSLYTKEIPFNETVSSDELTADTSLVADVKITSVKVNVDPTEDGVALTCSVIAEYSVNGLKNESVPVVLDCYLTEREVINEYEDFGYNEHIGVFSHSENVEEDIPKTELSSENIRELLLPNATVRVESVTPCGDTVDVHGILRFSGVACEIYESGELGFTGIKQDIPFDANVKCGCHIPGDANIICTPLVTSLTASATTADICPSVTVLLRLSVNKQRSMARLLSSVPSDEPLVDKGATVTVYYPCEKESLYDVGRKFHTPTLDIAADNSLTEEVFAADGESLTALGVKRLIIR